MTVETLETRPANCNTSRARARARKVLQFKQPVSTVSSVTSADLRRLAAIAARACRRWREPDVEEAESVICYWYGIALQQYRPGATSARTYALQIAGWRLTHHLRGQARYRARVVSMQERDE